MSAPKVIRKLKNPPALDINKVLYNREMPAHVRLEQRIVWNLLLVLEHAGFVPHSVDSGDEIISATSKKAAMEYLFNLDDAYLQFSHKSGEKIFGDDLHVGTLRTVWVHFKFGNGVDVISGYSATAWKSFQNTMDNFNAEVYA